MKDEFITFETAMLAKEKGFNEYCSRYYNINGVESSFTGYDIMKKYHKNDVLHNVDTDTEEQEHPKVFCTRPTQSLLQKWLREVHNKHIIIAYSKATNKYDVLYSSDNGSFNSSHNTYEEALEVGLVESLKRI